MKKSTATSERKEKNNNDGIDTTEEQQYGVFIVLEEFQVVRLIFYLEVYSYAERAFAPLTMFTDNRYDCIGHAHGVARCMNKTMQTIKLAHDHSTRCLND